MVYTPGLRVKASAQFTTPTSAPTITIPAGVHIGDIMVLILATNGGSSVFTPSTVTGTWTLQAQRANTSNGSSITIYTKTAIVGDPGSVQTWAVSPGARIGYSLRSYKDIDLSTPIDVTVLTGNGSSLAPTAPSETPTITGAISIFAACCSIAATGSPVAPTWTHPSTYSNDESTGSLGTSGAGNCFVFSADKTLSGTSATGTLIGAMDISHSWAAVQIILRPKTINTAPTVNAGTDQSVSGNDSVALSATATDADGDTTTITWGQVSGTTVFLTDHGDGTASFTAPNTSSTLVFRAVAFDGVDSGNDTISITITPRSSFTATLRATATNSSFATASATPTVIIPGTVHYGDVLVCAVVWNGIQTITTPGGWVLLASQANTSNGETTAIFQRVVDTLNDANSTVSWTLGSSGRWTVILRDYVDVDPANPDDISIIVGTGTSATPTATTGTSVTNNAMSLAIFTTSLAAPAVDLGWTAPAVGGYINPVLLNTTGTSGAGNVYSATYDKLLGAAGATGNLVAGINQTRQWVGIQLILKPKTANTPPVADAGADQTNVYPYTTVSLVGTSQDADGDTVTLAWAQTSGSPSVTVVDGGIGVATFIAPAVRAGTTLVFTLTADDGTDTRTDTISVVIYPHNEWAVVGGVEVPVNHSSVSSTS